MANILQQGQGLFTTLRTFFKKPITVQYPFTIRDYAPRFRGAVGFLPHPKTGDEKCVGCGLCAQICPIKCITMGVVEDDSEGEATDHSDEWHPFEHYYLPFQDPEKAEANGKKFRFFYDINESRCLFCGLCVEACPVEALTMSHVYEMSTESRADLVWGKDKLLRAGQMYQEQLRELQPSGMMRHIPLLPIPGTKQYNKALKNGDITEPAQVTYEYPTLRATNQLPAPAAPDPVADEGYEFDENGNRVPRRKRRVAERW